MSIHAVNNNMYVDNVVIQYRDRPTGSVSKLNTYSDGFKVIRTIMRLFRMYRPLLFFGIVTIVLALISLAFFVPVFAEYMQTGEVRRFPTLIVCGFTMVAAIQSLFSGLILQTICQKNRQDFEMQLYRAMEQQLHNRVF